MCGICGIASEKLCSLDNLHKMNNLLIHRGPDDEGYFIDGEFSMAMRRLSIIDPATGQQPISTPDGRYTIVLNGEIYNYKELKRTFLKEYHFKTTSDTEVLLYMFEKFGDSCLLHLDGMFAFCIFDKNSKEFFIARDRTGIKPLNYYYNNGNFLFSSEIKSFSKIKGIDLSFNLKYLNDYFSFGFIPSPYTFFKHIKKLEPGHFLRISKNKFFIQKYWEISIDSEQAVDINYQEAKENLKSIITSTVNKEMVSDVSIGAFLSGGLDSSIITYEMSKSTKSKINTYTITFEKSRNDHDKFFSRYISQKLGTNHTESKLDLMNTDINGIISRLDEPFAITSLIPVYHNSLIASKSVKVVLSGDGADEVFGGYSRHGKLKFLLALKNSKTLKKEFIDILNNKVSSNIPYRKLRKGFSQYIV